MCVIFLFFFCVLLDVFISSFQTSRVFNFYKLGSDEYYVIVFFWPRGVPEDLGKPILNKPYLESFLKTLLIRDYLAHPKTIQKPSFCYLKNPFSLFLLPENQWLKTWFLLPRFWLVFASHRSTHFASPRDDPLGLRRLPRGLHRNRRGSGGSSGEAELGVAVLRGL